MSALLYALLGGTESPTMAGVIKDLAGNSLATVTAQSVTNNVPWWLTGGISAANVVAAYRAKGAASFAASKVNLASPGTHDLTNAAAFPTWAGATGWSFVGASSQHLISDIVPAVGWSLFVQIASSIHSVNNIILGEYNGSTTQSLAELALNNADRMLYANGGFVQTTHAQVAGNLGVAGLQPYLDGVADGAAIATALSGAQLPIYIGARNDVTTGPVLFYTGAVRALAIYQAILTGPQALALATAMASL